MAGMEEVRVAAVHRPVRRWPLVAAGILLVLVWAAGGLARFFLDLWWFREVGKTQVFWGVLGAEVGLGLLTGLGTAVIVGGNLCIGGAQATSIPNTRWSGPGSLGAGCSPAGCADRSLRRCGPRSTACWSACRPSGE